MEIRDFTPTRIGNKYITFLLEISKCNKCNKEMIKKPKEPGGTFPYWGMLNFDAQALKAKLVIQSNVKVDDCYICKDCVERGEVDFLCALCETRKPTNKIEESFGYPPEYLCNDCYTTTTALIWDKKCNELDEDHRYDYE